MENVNLISVIIAGVTTGGLTCFAVQGGLLTSAIAHTRKIKEQTNPGQKHSDLLPLAAFVIAKVIAYTFIGALLGAFGGIFNFNAQTQAIIQVIIGIYMLGVAANLLNLHPIFRYFIIQPPQFLQRLVRKSTKGGDEIITPALLGLLTIFIPCGTTLAMEALAISTGSPLLGALIMATFVISSSWVFATVGLITTKLNENIQGLFYKITAATLVVLAVLSINSGFNLLGFPYTIDSIAAKPAGKVAAAETRKGEVEYDTQRVHITVDSRGYTASTKFLKKDIPVELTLETKNSYSCANAFTIPSMNIMKLMPENGIEKITFTPKKAGRLVYSCSMGMFRNEFLVQ